MNLLIALLAAAAVFLSAHLILGLASRGAARRRAVALGRLHAALRGDDAAARGDLLRRSDDDGARRLGRFLGRLGTARALSDLLAQARCRLSPAQFLLLSAFSGAVALLLAWLFADTEIAAGAAGALGALLPLFYVRRVRAKRMERFQIQLPDALELVARALKAGHAFNSGLRMVSDEFGEPLGPEFQTTLDEINFGLGADEALRNLANRVDCPDLKFFVVSVNIQRETGGNLAEIVTNIARLVRERFKLFGKVRILSAEGRLSAWILIALPLLAGLAIFFLNPEYLGKLFVHPLGKMMMTGAGINMALGILIIRRLVRIKV
ncbi:MAG: type II secretion system F family protein [Desulfovibrionaceae bacterium]|jgi:tight adherence protein B|nr:type II secretion system F family protein [Desulfovibrionaceae bacterium]